MRRYQATNLARALCRETSSGAGAMRPVGRRQWVPRGGSHLTSRSGNLSPAAQTLLTRVGGSEVAAGRLVTPEDAPSAMMVIEIDGTLDAAREPQLLRMVEERLGQGVRMLLLDLARVDRLFLGGVEAMVHAHRWLLRQGGRLVVVAPRPFQREMLRITGADRVFAVVSDRQNGLDRLGRLHH